MRTALADLRLDHLWVLYPGDEAYSIDHAITALPVAHVAGLARQLES